MEIKLNTSLSYIKKLEENNYEFILPVYYSKETDGYIYRSQLEPISEDGGFQLDNPDFLENALSLGETLSAEEIEEITTGLNLSEYIIKNRKVIYAENENNQYVVPKNTAIVISQTVSNIDAEMYVKMRFNVTIDKSEEGNSINSFTLIGVQIIGYTQENKEIFNEIVSKEIFMENEKFESLIENYGHSFSYDVLTYVELLED